MLTFEKVLEVFADYLKQDRLYEVVITSHGYTLMAWESERSQFLWEDIILWKTV